MKRKKPAKRPIILKTDKSFEEVIEDMWNDKYALKKDQKVKRKDGTAKRKDGSTPKKSG